MLRTILLLTASNIFMTFAWYGLFKKYRNSFMESYSNQLGNCFF
ncbi:DMT family protein [Ferruginibacter sp.]